MPVITGTSTLGGQIIRIWSATQPRYLAIDIVGNTNAAYRERLGLALFSQYVEDSTWRVVEVKKLFGTGVLFLPTYPVLPLAYVLWVDWYEAGLSWQADVP